MGKSQYPQHGDRLGAAMSDTHHHHGLSPSSVRFCPLCGGALARQPVPPEGKHEMVCDGCAFVFNSSDSSRPSRDIQPYLVCALRINVLRWELL